MQERRLDDALRYWELVWSLRPGYKRVDEYLKREYLMRGMEFFASGKLDDAVNCWQRVLQVDPKDSRATGYIARARTQQARTREILGGTMTRESSAPGRLEHPLDRRVRRRRSTTLIVLGVSGFMEKRTRDVLARGDRAA